MENLLLQHTSQSILKSAKDKVSQYEVYVMIIDILPSKAYHFAISKNDGSLPHAAYIGRDDIWCSCVGFTSTLKEKKLCKHLVMGFNKLIAESILTIDIAQDYLQQWTERQLNGSTTSN